MAKKFIQNIQKLIEEKDPKKDLGLVSEGNISHFQAKPPALVSSSFIDDPNPDPIPERGHILQNFLWQDYTFIHDKGEFADLDIQDFITHLLTQKNTITTQSGDFAVDIVDDHVNKLLVSTFTVSAPATITIQPFVNNNISLSVYLQAPGKDSIRIFSSGTTKYVNSDIILNLNETGVWGLGILLYQQKAPTTFYLLGNMGNYVSGSGLNQFIPDKAVTLNTSLKGSSFQSIFVDGASGPTLANQIFWDKLDISSEVLAKSSIDGYGMYQIVNERIISNVPTEPTHIDVVSGWGTDAFVVSGSKRIHFPLASVIGIPNPYDVGYKVSGTEFDSGANRTIVTVSGTAFLGTKFDPIWMEQSLHLSDITQDATVGTVISGTHLNVKAGDFYVYEVDTFNTEGIRGPRSARVSGTAGDLNPPGLVTSLAGTGSLKAIRLTWTNPTNIDLKGIHIFDTPTVISGTTKPIKTIIKGSNTTIPECTVINEVSSGTLIDQWPYDLYLATFDYAGNSSTENMPTVSVTTDVEIKTSREGQRIETDTSTNQLRFFDVNDNELVKIGENILNTSDGIRLNEAVIYATAATNDEDIITASFNLTDGSLQNDSSCFLGEVAIFGAGATQQNKIASIRGKLNGLNVTPGSDMICIHGQFIPNENEFSYSGYFEGANVFIEKNLIVSGFGGIKVSSGFQDLDGDTRIQVEESADEDIIRFDTAGTERLVVRADGDTKLSNEQNLILTADDNAIDQIAELRFNTFRDTDVDNVGAKIQFRSKLHSSFPDVWKSGQIRFYTNWLGVQQFNGLINSDGNWGVNTEFPGNTLSVAGIISGSSHLNIEGDIDHDGSNVGFYGTAPAAQSSAYTPTNVSTDRSYDADSTSTAELADVLGTLIADLQNIGLIG